MILQIEQTRHDMKITYEVTEQGSLLYTGRAPFLMEVGAVQLLSQAGDVLCKTRYRCSSFFDWLIPFTFVRSRKLNIYEILTDGGDSIGTFSRRSYKAIKFAYDLSLGEEVYTAYPLLRGKREVLLVYHGNEQIAQIERQTLTKDYKDSYTLYLPDDYRNLCEPLCFMVLYYDHVEHGERGKASKNYTRQEWSWAYSKANEIYDPGWLKRHFPDEAVPPVPIDSEYNRKAKTRLTATTYCLNVSFIIAVVAAASYVLIFGEPQAFLMFIAFVAVMRFLSVSKFKKLNETKN